MHGLLRNSNELKIDIWPTNSAKFHIEMIKYDICESTKISGEISKF